MPAITSSRSVQKAEAKYNVTTEYPDYGLHDASARGNIGLVSFALLNGQPPNAVLDGVLPIHAAASGGNTSVVRMLLDAGADINLGRLPRKLGSGGKGGTGTNASASGSAISFWSGAGGATAVHFAAANGHVDALMLLLSHGADHDKPDKNGVTPLMLAERLGQTAAASTLRDWAVANPPSSQPVSPSTPSINPPRDLRVKRSLETLFRRPWGGSRVDVNRFDYSASRVDLAAGGESRGELGSGSSGVDLGATESRSEFSELGQLPTSNNNGSRHSGQLAPSDTMPSSRSHRPGSARTTWSEGKGRMRRLFGRMKNDELGWHAGELVEVDWAEEVEFRRGERVAVEMGLKAPSARLLAANRIANANAKRATVRPRRKASEFHPEPDFEFFDRELTEGRTIREDDDDMEDDQDSELVEPALHPRSVSHSGSARPGWSTGRTGGLTSPSLPSLLLPNNIPSLTLSTATSTASVPSAATNSHAPSPGAYTHMRSASGGSTARRGVRASSSFGSLLSRQTEGIEPSDEESPVEKPTPAAAEMSVHPQGQNTKQSVQDGSHLQPPDGRFRGDSLSSTSSDNTNQLSSSIATTDTTMTATSLFSPATSLVPHKGAMTFSPVFEADDAEEVEEVQDSEEDKRRSRSITPLNLRSVSTFEQAQCLVRQVEREILEPGPQGPDSPSLAEQLAAYGESLAIEKRFARGEAQRRAWEAERANRGENRVGDEDEDEEYAYETTGPKIGAPLGRTVSVDYHAKARHIQTPVRGVPMRHSMNPLSSAMLPTLVPQTRTPERPSFSTSSSNTQQRAPHRATSNRSSYASRPDSVEIIEGATISDDSPPLRTPELHRRSASTGVPSAAWAGATFDRNITRSPDHSDDDSHYELNSRTAAPLSRITTAPSKIGNAIGNVFSRDPNYEPTRRKKIKHLVRQLTKTAIV